MITYRHIIWDWNGTLLDDVWLCREIVNRMLVRRGVPPLSTQKYKSIFDFPIKDYYKLAGFDFSKEPYEIMANEFCAEYAEYVGQCRLHDGAKELLEDCANAGVRQSIFSVTEQTRLDNMVSSFGITSFFDRVVGQADHYASGKSGMAKQLLAGLDAQGEQVLLVGDTTHDFQVAREIGVHCVLVSVGHHSREKLELTGARVLESLPRVKSLLSDCKLA
ncbi:MAG: HAD family hydrolase [Planctomycetes bacterium]|nr:HAD family hydrolase [Planctomycetota bacterium]